TLGTVAVAARVVGDAIVAAIETMLDVAAQLGRATGGQVTQRLALRDREHAAVLVEKSFAVLPDHIRHFQRRPRCNGGGHGWPSGFAEGGGGGGGGWGGRGTTSRSSRLGVWCRCGVLRCR